MIITFLGVNSKLIKHVYYKPYGRQCLDWVWKVCSLDIKLYN